ncbi:MAG: L,D-transpeptidase family protein [Prevotella sp.]|nr:L,D-transpeptidase family protein [Prevotella sp.]
MGLLFLACLFHSCEDEHVNPYRILSLDSLRELRESSYALNSQTIRSYLRRLSRADADSMIPDYRLREYYANERPFLWIDRNGLDNRADTLLRYLDGVEKMGFSQRKFAVPQIKEDLGRIRKLHLESKGDTLDINLLMARLEYNMTKAYLRYAVGQRYGFSNPTFLLNRIDEKQPSQQTVYDTTRYQKLFDIAIEHPTSAFYGKALRKITTDSVGEFLHDIQPTDSLYHRLLARVSNDSIGMEERGKLVCNLERCRWRMRDFQEWPDKYVLVNIPAFQLYAHDGDSLLPMRVVCGKFNTKTPLLASKIKRMDINPKWFIPKSIVENEVARHAGNRRWFESHRYFIRHRKTGKRIEPERVSWGMLKSGDYLVAQEGGPGNSLGRIIFRFDNPFSVFLHDTSSPGVFGRDNRGASHGCVRVQKPFDLAVYMLSKKDETTIDKLRYSMTADVSKKGNQYETDPETGEKVVVEDTLNRQRLIGSVDVSPEVPLLITYFTVFPDEKGVLRTYKDVYGYDRVIAHHLRNYRD